MAFRVPTPWFRKMGTSPRRRVHGVYKRNAMVGESFVMTKVDRRVGDRAHVLRQGRRKIRRVTGAGTPAKVLRMLSDDESHGKADGTKTYQDLTLRSLQPLKEVVPLTASSTDCALRSTPKASCRWLL